MTPFIPRVLAAQGVLVTAVGLTVTGDGGAKGTWNGVGCISPPGAVGSNAP
jgi:hypothetical protein